MVAKFGTSGLRGLSTELVGDTTIVYTLAFGRYLLDARLVSDLDPVYIGRDFRDSSPQIAELCAKALSALNLVPVDCGTLPTPALAAHAMKQGSACLMVTGSHIPADRNGIKFYRPDGEISKVDEAEICRYAALVTDTDLAAVRYGIPTEIKPDGTAVSAFADRVMRVLKPEALSGLRIGVYEHSTVARDLLVDTLIHYGADVTPLGRSETFIPVDTEAVSEETQAKLRSWAAEFKLDAIVSADGDGDRPLVADESGKPLRGDLLGLISALYLEAGTVVTPVTSNSSIEKNASFETYRTRVGSPFVIAGMESTASTGQSTVIGFEANGGVLVQSDFELGHAKLDALPTRDCFLPILAALQQVAADNKTLSDVAASHGLKVALADRLENYSSDRSSSLMDFLCGSEINLRSFLSPVGEVVSINTTDGLRITLDAERVIHLRPSGNAPEMRCYVEAETEDEAELLLQGGLSLLSQWTGSDIAEFSEAV